MPVSRTSVGASTGLQRRNLMHFSGYPGIGFRVLGLTKWIIDDGASTHDCTAIVAWCRYMGVKMLKDRRTAEKVASSWTCETDFSEF